MFYIHICLVISPAAEGQSKLIAGDNDQDEVDQEQAAIVEKILNASSYRARLSFMEKMKNMAGTRC